ncbi:MAG: hypothetical protein JSR82_10590 [Verrucomicrobia bacterium]|nr:hypothetical protein [Verrucomicrobiota bacterium]
MKNTDILERAVNWNTRGESLRLRPAEWILLSLIDGHRSVGDLVREGPADLPFAMTTLQKFIRLDLARIAELTWAEFCEIQPSAAFSASVTSASASPPPTPSSPSPLPSTDVAEVSLPASPSEPAPGRVRFRLAPTRPAAPERREEIAIPTKPLPRPPGAVAPVEVATVREAQPAPASKGLSLRGVLDFVIGTAGGGTRGQMAVYRTFLKVPVSQLRESGIKSVDLNNSEIEITDPALQTSILEAVKDVVGMPYQPA